MRDPMTKPRGLAVILAGPDGAGKSSLAGGLHEACRGLFRREVRVHWRPGLLPPHPDPSAGPVTEPHRDEPRGPIGSLAALGYWFLDFSLGGWLLLEPRRRRSDLVVVERGWWDMAVDPRRYRLRVPPGLVRALGLALPRPDLVLVLDAPAEVMHARKPELPLGELDRQRRAWLDLRIPRAEKVVLDATKPVEQVLADARETIVSHLERRAIARLGAGWTNLPTPGDPRWWLPRGPRRVARAGISVYQPVTRTGRIGWESARLAARVGGFRLLPRGEAPPREVRVRLAEHLPPRTTYAVMRANHDGRYVVLLLRDDGSAHAVAKIATMPGGAARLAREATALRDLGPALPPPLRPPRLLEETEGVLLLEAADWRPRSRPWHLEPDVASAIGAFWRATGYVHGDLAPWNVLRTGSGWVLCDWEDAAECDVPGWDLWHWIVQSHALLGRPGRAFAREVLRGEGRGWVRDVARACAEAAGVSLAELLQGLRVYVERSQAGLDPARPDGRRGLAARQALQEVLSA